ncbi:MAG: metal ABC transporter permease [Terrimicrobiaceae bacterium]|nr:metal ABC transporter permease [Terrimicrobiaceae bacterium]
MDALWRFLLLQDHNTRVVLAGACLFGAAAGLVGTFLLLRKRSLLGDTLGHATLPGVALAFLLAHAAGLSTRSLPILLGGAALAGVAGVGAVLLIRRISHIKDDAALAIVLSVFFGAGVTILTAVQQLPGGASAGLDHFIYGKTASMTSADATFIFWASLIVFAGCTALFKEFALLCFDESFAKAGGWPVRSLDILLMALVILITVVGIQAVGLLLVVALLVIPSAAARFWSDRLGVMAGVAAAVGLASSAAGVAVSAILPRLPAGALIVLSSAALFAVSFVFGTRRGLIVRSQDEHRAVKRLRREHLLRAIYECAEASGNAAAEKPVPVASVHEKRPWSARELAREIESAAEAGLLTTTPDDAQVRLTTRGFAEARRLVRNHRLWELYLLHHAEVAPGRVDRDADLIEHVLDPRLVAELEDLLDAERRRAFVPGDPEKLSP